MTVFVFTGPTVSANVARAELDAVYLPPVAQGDIYRVGQHRPQAIGIIDGYFERVPAVWHKEILWAMRQGIHVFGSASMGALRAAELAAFGMVGIGWVFEAFRNGRLVDDDEVAVAHGSGESGYRAQSDAMVDIRRTLEAAETAGRVSAATRFALEQIGKRLFYPDRCYVTILRGAAAAGVPASELAALEAWLPEGRVEQKRQDALAMLRAIRAALAQDPGPKRVRYHLEYTNVWDHARRWAGVLDVAADSSEPMLTERVLDELRLDPEAYAREWPRAVLRYLALDMAERRGVSGGRWSRPADGLEALRAALGLSDEEAVRFWLTERAIDAGEAERLIRDEARLRQIDLLIEREVASHLMDHLRLSGEYPRLAARVRAKRRALQTAGWDNSGLSDIGLTEAELLTWYFVHHLGKSIPQDIAEHAERLGFRDRASFLRALVSEYCYRKRTESSV